jgi:anti-sigma B factor antagonist
MASARFDEEWLSGGAHVVAVTGELEQTNIGELHRRVEALLDDGRARIVIDLDGVTHMDSSGLAELLTIHQRAGALGGALVVVVSSPPLLRTLEIRGVDGLLSIVPTRAAACAALG